MRTRWLATGYGTALASFVISALFFIDVFGEYFVNTYCIFPIAYWIEATVACVAAVVGAVLAIAIIGAGSGIMVSSIALPVHPLF